MDRMLDVAGRQNLSFISTTNFTNEGQIRVSYEGTNTILQANIDLDAAPNSKSSSMACSL